MKDVAMTREVVQGQLDALDGLSKRQDELLTALEPLQAFMDEWYAQYNRDMYVKHVEGGLRMPSEKLREQLAVTDPCFPTDVARQLAQVSAESDRVAKQISNTKAIVDGYRSVLSALKIEVESPV